MSPATTAPDAASPARARPPLRGFVLAGIVLVGSLLLVGLYAGHAERRERQLVQAELDAEAERVANALRDRLVSYELITRGGVALFGSVARPSAEQWRDYVVGLRLGEQFPGLYGLGYAASMTPVQLETLQRDLRDSGHGLFTVWPAGVRDRYGPILYLEPKTPNNLAALGFDMHAEPVRRDAMQRARDSGQSALSAPVRLLQDSEGKPGLLMYSPVYRTGSAHATSAQRRSAIQGWVYVPISVGRFVESALRNVPRAARFRISDRDVAGSGGVLHVEGAFDDAAGTDASSFTATRQLDLQGRRWQLDFMLAAGPAVGARMRELRRTLATGVLASFLLFGIMCALALTEARAQALATRMTEVSRRSETRLRNAMQYAAIGKALLDRDGRILDANPALVELLGAHREDLIGAMLGDRFVGGDRPLRTQETEAYEPGVYRTTRQLQRQGEMRHLQLTYSPMPAQEDDVARMVQIEDVTDRVRAEDRVQAMNRTLEARVAMRTRELTQANQELESFAYNISHDLRAPLRAIDGFSQLFEDRYAGVIDAAGRDYLARVRNAAARMDELIDAMLRMSRITRGEIRIVPVDLSAMAAEVVLGLRAVHPDRRVRVDIARGLRACGDAALLRNLLENLLGNAWKFTQGVDEARIEFSVAEEGQGAEYAAFRIRDNGAGFPPEYGSKLFRPFQRLHTQAQFSGHGIGLASVKRVIERHGGVIRAEGAPGQGAAFYFTLPKESPA